METSLHRQLKELYAGGSDRQEVAVGGYRIDAVAGQELVEIQHGSLAAIRDKIAALLPEHRVRVVKPIVARKWLVRQDAPGGQVLGRRLSPKRCTVLDLFHELVYFTRVFPHPHLVLEVPLVDVEEWRYPGHGRRRRRRAQDHVCQDQKLLAIGRVYQFRTPADLARLVPRQLKSPFHTGQLSEALDVPRWVAQRIAYCFRQTGAAAEVGRSGNARLYALRRRAS